MHPPDRVSLRHLLVHDPFSGCHPLDVTGSYGATISNAVTMLHGSGKDVRDGLDSAMGMPGETGPIVVGILIAKIVQKKERIEFLGLTKPKRSSELDSRTFCGRFCLDNLFDCLYNLLKNIIKSFIYINDVSFI